jgi:hypothetical protein
MHTEVIAKTEMAAICKARDKKGTPHPLSRVSLDSGHREGAARKDVNAHTHPSHLAGSQLPWSMPLPCPRQ